MTSSHSNKKYYIKQVLETNYIGLREILKFYDFAKNFRYTTVVLNIEESNNIDANLSCVILAIAHKLFDERKVKVFLEIDPKKQNVFFRNGLISHLQGQGNNNKYYDERQSTISLKTFNKYEDDNYCDYLVKDFFSHRGLSNLNRSIKENLKTHYLEIFNNVELHANTEFPVFTCGQYFPEKNVLKFSLIDLGDGFLRKIKDYTSGKISDDNSAIIWATEKTNSTKNREIYGPGGTGLKALKKYCNENNGSLHICSGYGYVNMLAGKTLEYKLPIYLFGSLINIIFRNI